MTSPQTRPATFAGTAIIVGASLSGLMTALSLSRIGMSVTMLERSDDNGRTGASLSAVEGMLERLTGKPPTADQPAMRGGIQTWVAVHDCLRAAVDRDPAIEVVHHAQVRELGQNQHHAWAEACDGQVFAADMVIGADGYRSVVRRFVAPDRPDASFAGYLIWLGISDETAISPPYPSGFAYHEAEGYCFLGAPLPGVDGSTESGRRRVSWAWYDGGCDTLLRSTGAVVDRVVQRTLRADEIPDDIYAELAAKAERLWPDPWREAIHDCVARHSIIATPTAEYVPERLARGRLCLVGDAAHLPTPMTAMGLRSAFDDALALADAISLSNRGNSSLPETLASYERARLTIAKQIVLAGRNFSRDFMRTARSRRVA
ncbi:FAD-dependent monooxygenase [Sphingomonas phyllosphaerae]|uniref:FAD-dependent monooxygenase n=1 Tax=Sphingomonas phyllosphaerae TaxID=257003 RepID=UPI00241355C8|nr:FAD-dependent monooxygenase [Sphingomonas phyllosphaerae]